MHPPADRQSRVVRYKEKRGSTIAGQPPLVMAGSMGLEPTASGVTGRRYNQLNYDPETQFITLLLKPDAVVQTT